MRRRKAARERAELLAAIESAEQNGGNVGDGGLVVIDHDGEAFHYAPADVTSALRYALGRLQTSEKGEVHSCISVTSATAGEGVTYVAGALAALLANDFDRKVCLVDLNWWSAAGPAGTDDDGFDLDPPGVAQIINGRRKLDEVLVATLGGNLSILPAGPASQAERPVLAKASALVELVAELTLRFDHIILDVPPVLATGEAITLAALAECFILVVRQGVTAQQQVQAALDELRHISPLGVVLNRTESRVPDRLVRMLAG